MLLEADVNCFIAPCGRVAKKLATMLKNQGDMRGILVEPDDTLVVFDSYGFTHMDVIQALKVRVNVCIIFRPDGEIYVDSDFSNWRRHRLHELEKMFAASECELFRKMYAYLGISDVKVTNWD